MIEHRPLTDRNTKTDRPLTDEEARKLAGRWAWWRDGGPESIPKPHTTEQLIKNVDLMSAMCVTSEDVERLLAWVRDRMAGYVEGCLDCMEQWVWSEDLESDRDEMAGWIAGDLGLDGRGDPVAEVLASRHGAEDPVQARALCEAAGWPS